MSPTYLCWRSMRDRCLNPNAGKYPQYGGAGVAVCERWNAFENFLADMGLRPVGTTLDRHPDREGNYEPGNCRLATPTQQNRNRRFNVLIDFRGEQVLLAEAAERLGLKYSTAYMRFQRTGSIEQGKR